MCGLHIGSQLIVLSLKSLRDFARLAIQCFQITELSTYENGKRW